MRPPTLPNSNLLADYYDEKFMIPITRALSSRVVRPPGVEFDDTMNDAVVIYIRRLNQLKDASPQEFKSLLHNLPIGKWLWVRVLGDLRDIYKRDWHRLIYGPRVIGGFNGGNGELVEGASKKHERRRERADSDERMESIYQYLLDTATDQYALVFHRLFIEGRTQVEVAEELGVTQPRVSSIKRRIQSLIREHLVGAPQQ